ncbi:MAG: NAD(+)/NADH kinase [Alicyclobacillus herbarius]|uniref:NAD(+)/NADH kinase n=1 Tax=Alicyclobacillus herbarius TaxID=122960 RepID=UPI0003FCC0A6|nr:NAD(+)/NADH kinase [Alicyclobacillus herbarius]MCL6633631.1 NAD(+)/NADH kinase [Alicyclobacillus herbarius]
MRTIAVVANPNKPRALDVQSALARRLESSGLNVYSEKIAINRGWPESVRSHLAQAELVCVLGGDGTLLGVARELVGRNVPLLGINMGRLGFLTEAEPADLDDIVHRLVHRDYDLENRLMLEANVSRDGKEFERMVALNEVGVAKAAFGHMVTVDTYVDGVFLDSYSGDGVIISTPTGSTGYSLSCGGPIVCPHLSVILITPICPHTLSTRPCVVDDTQHIHLVAHAAHEDLVMTVDGQVSVRLQPGDAVDIRRSPADAVLVKWRDREFFSVLRTKLHGGEGNR